MCGIAGLIDWHGRLPAPERVVERMTSALRARGPDGAGVWIDREARVGFGHRRLAIIDLSPLGKQPMASANGRYTVTFNGEIYNFTEIRAALEKEGATFRGRSDTEVLVEAVAAWGIEETLPRLTGMFAFAAWDRHARVLYLARDRIGKKPLYYGNIAGLFVFGSELKAFTSVPQVSRGLHIDRAALAGMMQYGYVRGTQTIYEGVHTLPPGALLTVHSANELGQQVRRYWSLRELAAAEDSLLDATPAEVVERLHGLIRETVRDRLVADVPVGAFLSGGIDSSTVVAVMQELSSRPVKTFSIGFHQGLFDETEQARETARRLGTDHTELRVTAQQALDVIPHLPAVFDEPFADSSAIPTLLVSELARRQVTVTLSGDGGDELFFGYRRYFDARRWWRRMGAVPYPLRRAAAAGLGWCSPLSARVAELGDLLGCRTLEELYQWRTAQWRDPGRLVLSDRRGREIRCSGGEETAARDPMRHMMEKDQRAYLPDDILVKLDRASMSQSLESRAPLLDHRLIEFAWRLPPGMMALDGRGKWPLRQVLYRYLPAAQFGPTKRGFGLPLRRWLHGDLREWAEDLLAESRLRRDDFLEAGVVRRAWDDLLAGRRDNAQRIWNVLMFQSWLDHRHLSTRCEEPAAGLAVRYADGAADGGWA